MVSDVEGRERTFQSWTKDQELGCAKNELFHRWTESQLPEKPTSPYLTPQSSSMKADLDSNQSVNPEGRRSSSFSIDTALSFANYPVVSLCAKVLGFQEYPSGRDDNQPCDIYWCNVAHLDFSTVVKSPGSRVNKLPGMTEHSKKVSLTHAISSMEKLFPQAYMFYPRSFFLPAHYEDLKTYWKQTLLRHKEQGRDEEPYFIVKPNEGAQGTGIYLINDLSQIKDLTMEQLVQEYVADPFLMKDQLKFDFRVYGVIKSLNPLSIYVSREGMARFCTMKYEKPAPSNFDNLFSHLTNYSLNKASQTYVHSNSLEDQVTGSKRLLSTVFYQMGVCGMKTKKLWHDVKLIVVKTVLAMVPELMIHYEHQFHRKRGPQCFQIVGFDIMVREDGSPVLLEVNASPSLSIEHSPHNNSRQKSIVDEVIKIPLVRDTLLLVTGQLLEATKVANSTSQGSSRSTDDLKILKMAKRPYLSEIFPNRYGCEVADLLFLDQMVYIFMQYANLRLSTTIGVLSLKRIIKDCGIQLYFIGNEVERKIKEISECFNCHTNIEDLSFHGFVNFMIFLANRRFHGEPTLQDRLTCLMKACVSALRHKGVRSRRLRREELHEKSGAAKKIYLLPSRTSKRRSKSCEPTKIGHQNMDRNADRNNNNKCNVMFPQIFQK